MISIYGKYNCPACGNAIELASRMGEYEYFQLDEDFTREQLLERVPSAKTYPQIWVDGTHIGGYDDLLRYYYNAARTKGV